MCINAIKAAAWPNGLLQMPQANAWPVASWLLQEQAPAFMLYICMTLE